MSSNNFRSMPLPVLGNLARVTIAHTQRSGNEKILGGLLFSVLVERYERFDAALLRENSTKMGAEIKRADVFRTDTFRGIVKLLSGYEILGGSVARAASELLQVVRSQKTVSKMSYGEKSEVFLKFIKEFSTEDNQLLIAELRLTEYFDRFREAQTSFDAIVHEKQNALSELRQMEWASHIRPELEQALRNYFGFVDMMKGEADFRDLHFDLEQARMTAAGARRNRKPKSDDDKSKNDKSDDEITRVSTIEPSDEAVPDDTEPPIDDAESPVSDEQWEQDVKPMQIVQAEQYRPIQNEQQEREQHEPPEQIDVAEWQE